MNKYYIEIPLKYNKQSNLEKYDYSSDLKLELKNDINVKYNINITNGDFISTESIILKVSKRDEDFLLTIDSFYLDSEEFAIDYTIELANKVCYILTYIVQNQNSNPHYFHPKFTFMIRDIKCKEEVYTKYSQYIEVSENGNKTLHLSDRLRFKDSVHMTMTLPINTDSFENIFNLLSANKHLKFIIEAYYRANGDIEFISKFYNLFSIIEYIETNFLNEASTKKLLNDEQRKAIVKVSIEKVKDFFNDDNRNSSYLGRINGRLVQVLTEATDKTRVEKLITIIKDYFKIEKTDHPVFGYVITEEKLKDFIDTRNDLFHARPLDDEEINKLTRRTNELMVLCENILNKLILNHQNQCKTTLVKN